MTSRDAIVRFEILGSDNGGVVSPGIFTGSCDALICRETFKNVHVLPAETGVRYFIVVPKDDSFFVQLRSFSVHLAVSPLR